MTDKQVFQDEYFTVLVDERRGIVRTIRSSTPFPSIEELGGIFTRLGDVLGYDGGHDGEFTAKSVGVAAVTA